MDGTDWGKFSDWSRMFDALCDRAGYFDDTALASAYCALTQSKGQKQFETTLRNLNNWRTGRHLPRPANLRVLTKLLKLDEDPAAAAHWNALYKRAREVEAKGTDIVAAGEVLPAAKATTSMMTPQPQVVTVYESALSGRKRWSNLQALLGGLVLLIAGGAAGAAITASGWRPWGGPADGKPIIQFKPDVRMRVGDSRPIYAYRGDCGILPPAWGVIASELPDPKLGTLTDGGLAQKNSKFCKGLTPAQAIVFTARQAGVEEFEIQGDFFKMTVDPAP